jgi:hypothetical protein
MTPFVPLADGAQAEIFFHFGGETIENRLWFVDRSPPIVQAHLDSLAAGVDGWYQSEMIGNLSVDIEYVGVLIRKWDDHDGDLTSSIHTSVFGGESDEAHSANVASRIWFQSARGPDFVMNSNFVAGVPKDKVSLNTVDITWRSAVRNAYIDLIDLAAGFGTFPAWRWVCASAWDAGSLRTVQHARRTDFIMHKSPYVAQRRKRLPV